VSTPAADAEKAARALTGLTPTFSATGKASPGQSQAFGVERLREESPFANKQYVSVGVDGLGIRREQLDAIRRIE
jgi:hypothetical protein